MESESERGTALYEILIASVTPEHLERGDLWFRENADAIKTAREKNAWWRRETMILERDLVIKPGEMIHRLIEFGYERAHTVLGRGLFAVRGGTIELWPINAEKPVLIEWSGNTVASIGIRKDAEGKKTSVPVFKHTDPDKLPPGSYVVHIDHGIGIFRDTITRNGEKFFVVEYAPPTSGKDPDRLFIPTSARDRISPYIGFDTPRIHRLGGTVWQKTRHAAKENAVKLAEELLALYEKRFHAEREPHRGDMIFEEELRRTFPYRETDDQIRAEKEIMDDLAGTQPMDRILCGDVGFGKTEVALRAALRVVSSGKQVAIVAPTTILAAQHEKTFRERIGNEIPATIASLTRLITPTEERNIVAGINKGSIDIIIGTHRLFSSDIHFKNLGLVIIDEEQRFGVKQKEHFKNLRADIDMLSLSATPIPRTLSLTIAKLRGISRLDTPPPERLPIETFVLPRSPKTIAGAISHELERGGQVYFLHNRIETIERAKERILDLMKRKPRIGIIHGKMHERELIRTMTRFRERTIDVLIATTIIENGLDISSANTLIVDDATRLGLAEAHQLRGRIGRSSAKAFAYFLYSPQHLTEKSLNRLDALKEYAELGSGYAIALRDLEIRGAGNVLGREQSGSINRVGLNLYCQMLSEAVEERRSK